MDLKHIKISNIKIKNFILFLFIFSVFNTEITHAQTVINYTADNTVFRNPDRGFYKYTSYNQPSGSTDPDVNNLSTYKSAGHSLVLRIYYLDKNNPISATYLSAIETHMQKIRAAGMKCVLRFAYTDAGSSDDATITTVLQHLNQLQPSIQKNADIIAIMQMGFIGAWGEGYYTNNFGNTGTISSIDWDNRKKVLLKCLEVLPKGRMVANRYPWHKRQMLGRTTPITEAEAFNGSDWSRVGYHNDGFLSDSQDWGTFPNATDRDFVAAESMYLSSGGEVEHSVESISDCPNATTQIARFHYSYLNIDYNRASIDKWVTQGCFNDIDKKLGYRFSLLNSTYTNQVKPGGTFNLKINLENQGYAAPFNHRMVEVVIKNKLDGKICRVKLNLDPRKWLPGQVALNENIGLPANYPEGTYRIYLNLPDSAVNLYGKPDYSIRLANVNVWDPLTGFNDLGIDLVVSNTASSIAYTGTQWFDACYGAVVSNNPPTGTLTSPSNNAIFASGANIILSTTAADTDGTVSKVEFFNGNTKLGEALTSPYSITWNAVPNGVYQIYAKVTDNLGATATSNTNTITVGNLKPKVSITNPVNGMNFQPGTSISIQATASDQDGFITKVQFFAGLTKIGEVLTSPYNITWNGAPNGNYILKAIATDNKGDTAGSNEVKISVNTMAMCTATGQILREVWMGVTGKTVDAVNWSSTPTSSSFLNQFEAPTNIADNYGARIRGYICPPTSGDYTFYIASDDNSELWLSTDDAPAHKVKIAWVTAWTNPREWTKYPEQKSVVLTLIANRKYYIEALHKEADYGDNLGVGWMIPGSSIINIIPGANLSEFSSLITSVEQTTATALELFPNPAKEEITIQSAVPIDSITICDIQGRVVYRNTESFSGTKKILLSGISTGMYFIYATGENANLIKKIIIE
jgi:hypothetical protein